MFWKDEDLLNRLRRIEGQVRGVQAMIARRERCQAILTQIAAIDGAMVQVDRIVRACAVAENLDAITHFSDAEAVFDQIKPLIR